MQNQINRLLCIAGGALIALIFTGCPVTPPSAQTPDTTLRFEAGQVCLMRTGGDSICVPLGGNSIAKLEEVNEDSLVLVGAQSPLPGITPSLVRRAKVLTFDPAHTRGYKTGTTIHIVETAPTSAADTLLNIEFNMMPFRFVAIFKASGTAGGQDRTAMSFCCAEPCYDNRTDISELLVTHNTLVLGRYDNCVMASGGAGIIVIESNIIDPTMRVSLTELAPDLKPWIQELYPGVHVPEIVSDRWLTPLDRPTMGKNAFIPPIQMDGGDEDCPTRAEFEDMLDPIAWKSVCTFEWGQYEMTYCEQEVTFTDADGSQVAVFDVNACPIQFHRVDGMVKISIPKDCTQVLDLAGCGDTQ